ncbi:MAG: phage tail protein [Marinagarivorans sp.]|nr:phage tail protein [Marinagarivorans sp.]
MIETYEAWKDSRPVFNRLPGINGSYQCNVLSQYLTAFPDNELASAKLIALDDIERQADPLRCDAIWLDFLASLCGWHGEYWDANWPEPAKRILLANSYTLIWPKYGTPEVLSFVLNTLGVRHVIQQGQSFIIGRETVGDRLGAIAWEYDIVLPTSFFNSDLQKLTKQINRLFGPIWCRSRILFDDDYFEGVGFYLVDSDATSATLLTIDNDGTVLQVE